MKKVFTDISQVAHLWANKVQEEARNSGNFYFSGDTIYSYGSHFPIAKHVTYNGKEAVLFTTRTYSNTTSKHIGVVKMACRHLNVIYCQNPENSHSSNLENFQTRLEEIAKGLNRARKPEIYLNQISQINEEIRKYIEFFEIVVSEQLSILMNVDNKEYWIDYLEKKNNIIKEENKRRQKEEEKKYKKELNKWLSGESSRLYGYSNKQDWLRMYNGRIQTSQAVEIPIEMGKRLYSSIKENTMKVGDKVLNYDVREIGKEYKIGCHTFPRKYLLSWGEKYLLNN